MGMALVLRAETKVDPPRQDSGDPSTLDTFADESPVLDLDKSAEGIQYLLTGEGWAEDDEMATGRPEYWLLQGGRNLLSDDIEETLEALENGITPAREMNADEVRRWAEFLATVKETDLRARFNPDDMAERRIYPESMWKSKARPGESLEYLMENFAALRTFVKARAAASEAISFHIV